MSQRQFPRVAGVVLPQFVVDKNEVENYFGGTTVPKTWARPRLT